MTFSNFQEHFFYKDGLLFWKKTNKEAGWVTDKGYKRVQLNKKTYRHSQTHMFFYLISGSVSTTYIEYAGIFCL